MTNANVCGIPTVAGRLWAEQQGLDYDDPATPWEDPCCSASAMATPLSCTCWEAVYDTEQLMPVEPLAECQVMAKACEDCAYRADSPERADSYSAEKLLDLPSSGRVFYCHDGMRRPVAWRHPDGREVAGDPADYHPPIVAGVPYRADGTPGRICRGWWIRSTSVEADA